MNLIQKMIFNNDCFKQGRTIAVKGLMLHSVGCNQNSAMVFINLWNKPRVTKAVHAFIEPNGNVYQILPFSMRGWHGGGSSNNTHLGFEMTEPASIKYTSGSTWIDLNPANTRAHVIGTYKTAVELFAYLCKELNLNPLADGVIISHLEGSGRGIASRHFDPEHIWNKFGLTMNQFRLDVKNAMNPVIAPTPPISRGGSMPNPTPNVAIRMLIDNHQIMASTDMPKIKAELIKRIDSGAGKIGVLTDIKGNILFRYEKVKKVTVPSTPVNSGGGGSMPNPTQKPILRLNSNGQFVAELQTKLNTLGFNVGKVDGDFRDKTLKGVIAFQKANGLLPDGVVGNNSWKALDYIKPAPIPVPQPQGKKAIVTASKLNIRKNANLLSSKVGFYNLNEIILVIEEKNLWCRTNRGWISKQYLRFL